VNLTRWSSPSYSARDCADLDRTARRGFRMSRKPSLLVIFLTVFLDLVGFGIVLPLLPLYGEHYDAKGWQIGLLMASYSLMQFLFAPAWGRLSDRIGRRPVLLVSTAGAVASYAMFAWATRFTGA